MNLQPDGAAAILCARSETLPKIRATKVRAERWRGALSEPSHSSRKCSPSSWEAFADSGMQPNSADSDQLDHKHAALKRQSILTV